MRTLWLLAFCLVSQVSAGSPFHEDPARTRGESPLREALAEIPRSAARLSTRDVDLTTAVGELAKGLSNSENKAVEALRSIQRIAGADRYYDTDHITKINLDFLKNDTLPRLIRGEENPDLQESYLELLKALLVFQKRPFHEDLYDEKGEFQAQVAGRILRMDPELLELADYLELDPTSHLGFQRLHINPDEWHYDPSLPNYFPGGFLSMTHAIASDFESHLPDSIVNDEETLKNEALRSAAVKEGTNYARQYLFRDLMLPDPNPGENVHQFMMRRQQENVHLSETMGHLLDYLTHDLKIDFFNPYTVPLGLYHDVKRGIASTPPEHHKEEAFRAAKAYAEDVEATFSLETLNYGNYVVGEVEGTQGSVPLTSIHGARGSIARLALEAAFKEYFQSPGEFYANLANFEGMPSMPEPDYSSIQEPVAAEPESAAEYFFKRGRPYIDRYYWDQNP